MNKKSEYLKNFRIAWKNRIIASMGGKCCICGYNKSQRALALHHLDPNKKDFELGSVRANPKNWQAIVKELRKCVLVCQNCHCEIHDNLVSIPETAPLFNEKYANYKSLEVKKSNFTPCLVCNKPKPAHYRTCSKVCSNKSRYKIDWNSIDLKKELENKSAVKLAEELGISDAAIYKRLRKIHSGVAQQVVAANC